MDDMYPKSLWMLVPQEQYWSDGTENWRDMAEKNATDLQKLFRDNKVDFFVNADQNFVYVYPKDHVVVVPKGVERVGGNINLYTKAGFTAMFSCDIESSNMAALYSYTMVLDSRMRRTKQLCWRGSSGIGVTSQMDV